MLSGARLTLKVSRRDDACWSCGIQVLTRADGSYTCHACDVCLDPLGDPDLRARGQARELRAQMTRYGIDGWLDHGDPGQRRSAPALTRRHAW